MYIFPSANFQTCTARGKAKIKLRKRPIFLVRLDNLLFKSTRFTCWIRLCHRTCLPFWPVSVNWDQQYVNLHCIGVNVQFNIQSSVLKIGMPPISHVYNLLKIELGCVPWKFFIVTHWIQMDRYMITVKYNFQTNICRKKR